MPGTFSTEPPHPPAAQWRRLAHLLLLAVFFAGLAHIAALPPFEGYDETAHWSSVQQIAQQGHSPVYGRDHVSADLDRYPGPMASATGQPYQAWFARTPASGAVAATGPTSYAQGSDINWQAQHPPLYYIAMAPIYRLAARLDWMHHMFLLRLVSWGIAFAGFAWGALCTQALLARRGLADARLLLPASWPFLFPEFFPEFARLTNDALVMLLFAAVWAITVQASQAGLSTVACVKHRFNPREKVRSKSRAVLQHAKRRGPRAGRVTCSFWRAGARPTLSAQPLG